MTLFSRTAPLSLYEIKGLPYFLRALSSAVCLCMLDPAASTPIPYLALISAVFVEVTSSLGPSLVGIKNVASF